MRRKHARPAPNRQVGAAAAALIAPSSAIRTPDACRNRLRGKQCAWPASSRAGRTAGGARRQGHAMRAAHHDATWPVGLAMLSQLGSQPPALYWYLFRQHAPGRVPGADLREGCIPLAPWTGRRQRHRSSRSAPLRETVRDVETGGLLQCSSCSPLKGRDNNWSNVEGRPGRAAAPVQMLQLGRLEQSC